MCSRSLQICIALLQFLAACAANPQQQPPPSNGCDPPLVVEIARRADGRIARSLAARRAFQREQPCPSTDRRAGACPGYVVDHIVPLACRGPDLPCNMQWQTREAARAKDRVELRDCEL